MKISCPSCSAKYSVADEKIQARLAKIRCRKCSSTIVIDGTVDPARISVAEANPPSAGSSEPQQPQAAAPSAAEPPASEAGGPSAGEYAVDIADNDQRNMSVPQIVAAYNEGVITAETYIWREGMSDWQTLAEVPEIAAALHAAAAEASAPAQIAAVGETPSATENSSADLFGGIDRAGGEDDITTSAPQDDYQATAGTGARNESSVLFSLSALTASDAGAGAPADSPGRPSDDSGLIDLQALTNAGPAPSSPGSVPGGASGGFAASPLMSAPLGGVSGPVLGGPMGGGGYPKRSGARGWILGGFGLLAVGLIVFVFLFKQGGDKIPAVSAEAPKSKVVAAEKKVVAELPDKKAEPLAEVQKPAEKEPAQEEPKALSPKDLDEVKAPPPVAKKARPKARPKPRPKSRPARSKPKARPASKPAPKPVAAKTTKKKKKKKKKSRCNCKPSDLMCAMRCSARK